MTAPGAGVARFGPVPESIDPANLAAWTVHADADVVVFDKPGGVVCHPSKRGPCSSLVGAVRLATGRETLHLVSRLDRETSGIVIIARHAAAARAYQMAFQRRQVAKVYLAVLEGTLGGEVTVDQPLARDRDGPVGIRMAVDPAAPDAKAARTHFTPLATGGGYTLARVVPLTGRMHQIRAHAAWLGHPVAGDKIYGPDPRLYLDFIRDGWSAQLQAALPHHRHLLHAAALTFDMPETDAASAVARSFTAPVAADMVAFCRERMGVGDVDARGVPFPSVLAPSASRGAP